MYVCMYVCNQGVATNQLGGTHIHAMHAGGRFGTSVE